MTIRSSSSSGIPFGDNDGRPANPATGQPYFNGEEKRLELYTAIGWQNITSETPGVVSITNQYLESSSTNEIQISGTNFATGAIASAIGTNGVEVNANSTTVNSIVSVTAVFSNLSADYEPYDIKVVNPSNLFGFLPDCLYVNESPVWTTSAGSLGSFIEGASISIQAVASDPENNTLTYSSSNLPSWLSLNSSTGAITGTATSVSSQTTYSFTINVSDSSNSSVGRSFSVTVNPYPSLSGGTLTSDSTYYYRTFASNGSLVVSDASISGVDILTYAGGGAGGSQHGGGGGGAGGYVYLTNQTLNAATYSVTVGAGGAYTTRENGSNSQFGALTAAIGGGAGAAEGQDNSISARTGGSGGGGGGTYPAAYMAGAAGTAVQGNAGGNATQTSTYSGGAGGGGAGSVGANNSGQGDGSSSGGNGGSGLNTWSSWPSISSLGTSGYICGGGGGGSWSTGTNTRGFGQAGGGNGAVNGEAYASAAVAGSGSGGGGSSGAGAPGGRYGGNGGSGQVIIRYTKASVGG